MMKKMRVQEKRRTLVPSSFSWPIWPLPATIVTSLMSFPSLVAYPPLDLADLFSSSLPLIISYYRFKSWSLKFWLHTAPSSRLRLMFGVSFFIHLSPTSVHRGAAVSFLFPMPVHCRAIVSLRAASSALDTKQVTASAKYQQQQAPSNSVLLNAVSTSN
jgi:hypothetical protein